MGASVTFNGARLRYWTEGSGEPLLLIEGGPGACGCLDLFFKELTMPVLITVSRFDRTVPPASRPAIPHLRPAG